MAMATIRLAASSSVEGIPALYGCDLSSVKRFDWPAIYPRHIPEEIAMRPSLLPVLFVAYLAACQAPSDPESLMHAGAALQARGELRAAVIQFRNAVQGAPNNPEARRRLADAYLEQGDGVSAEKELRKAAQLRPDPALQASIGKALLLQGKPEEALAMLLDAAATPAVAAVRAQAHLAQGETIAARRAFEAALHTEPAFLPALIGMGQVAALDGQADEATRIAKDLLERFPHSPEAIRFAAALKLEAGQHVEALGLLRQVLSLRPGDAHTHLDVAKLLIDAGKFKDAQYAIEAARRSASGGLHIVYTLALLEFRQNHPAEAKEHLQQILKVAPDYPPALLLSGAIELSLGTRQLAITHLERFLSTNPGHPHASRLLGAAHLQAGHAQPALALATAALKAHPDDVELLAIAGEANLRLGQHTIAASLFEKASTLAPDKPALRAAIGISSLGAGDTARAIAELEKLPPMSGMVSRSGVVLVLSHLKARRADAALAVINKLEASGRSPYLLNLKGAALLGTNDPAGARSSFEAALKLDPLHLPALDNLAQLDLMQARPGEARKRYQTALKAGPRNHLLMESMARFETSTGNVAAARQLLEASQKLQPDSPPAALRLADFMFRSGDTSKAIALVRAVHSSNPDSIDALALLAQMQRQARQFAAATESYARLATLSPQPAQVMLLQAAVQIEARDYAAAIDTLRKVQAKQPDLFDAYALHVAALGAEKKYTEALEVARNVQQRKRGWDAGYQLEGDVHMAARNYRAAAGAYQAGLALRQNGALARLLHSAQVRDGRQQEADSQMATWIRKHPGDADSRLYFAGALAASGKFGEARSQLEAVVRQRPADAVALNELALAYHHSKDPRALPTAQQALAQAPHSPEILDTTGWMLVQLGKASQGLPLLRRAVAIAPGAATPGLHLAAALAGSGDKAAARRELDRLATADPRIASREDFKTLRSRL
jgi:putative PEP-CTERM system TPR-repeat lipoprotein